MEMMKQRLWTLVLPCLLLSSCCTVFTSSKQAVTFTAPNGTKIYDAATNLKIAEVKQDNTVTTQIKKERESRLGGFEILILRMVRNNLDLFLSEVLFTFLFPFAFGIAGRCCLYHFR